MLKLVNWKKKRFAVTYGPNLVKLTRLNHRYVWDFFLLNMVRQNILLPYLSQMWYGAAHAYGSFYGPHAVGVSPLCFATFEADSSIRLKVIRGPKNFEIGSRDLGHAHLVVILCSTRSRGPSSMSVPNLKRISLFV